ALPITDAPALARRFHCSMDRAEYSQVTESMASTVGVPWSARPTTRFSPVVVGATNVGRYIAGCTTHVARCCSATRSRRPSTRRARCTTRIVAAAKARASAQRRYRSERGGARSLSVMSHLLHGWSTRRRSLVSTGYSLVSRCASRILHASHLRGGEV